MEDDEAPDPRDVRLLGAAAQVAGPQGPADAVEETRLRGLGRAALAERPPSHAPAAGRLRRVLSWAASLHDSHDPCPGPCDRAAYGMGGTLRKSPIGYARTLASVAGDRDRLWAGMSRRQDARALGGVGIDPGRPIRAL